MASAEDSHSPQRPTISTTEEGANRWRDVIDASLVQNVFSLYGVQIALYLFPLATVPYLARVLGPEMWGVVAFAQAFGQYLTLGVEYGFNLSGTRQIARARNSVDRRAELLAGVVGAKLVLSVLAVAVALLLARYVPIFKEHPAVLWAGVAWGIATAFSFVWYFQGLERMRLVALLEVGTKAIAVVGIFLLIRQPSDAWKVLATMAAASTASSLVALVLTYRDTPFRLPGRSDTIGAFRLGWSMFVFKGAVSLYTVANVIILGLFAPARFVGYYAGAEKISKAFLGLLSPVGIALYPRLSSLVQESRARAARLAKTSIWIMGSGGLLIGIFVFAFAPLLVRLLLGAGYEPAIIALRLLALLPPLIALSNVFGIQWMLPLGLDRPFNKVILLAGVINISIAVMLARPLAHIGMAIAVVTSELIVTTGVYLALQKRALNPFTLVSPKKGP